MSIFKKSEPLTVEVKGHELKCPVCGNIYFRTKHVLLNTTLATFFNLDWANRQATCFVCSDCTHIFWFLG